MSAPEECPVRQWKRGELEPGPRTLLSTRPVTAREIARQAGFSLREARESLQRLRESGFVEELPCSCGRCGGSVWLLALPPDLAEGSKGGPPWRS